MSSALTRYRVMAWVVGVMLLVLVLVAVPLNHLGHRPTLSEIVGPAHGFLFVVYLVTALDICVRMRFSIIRSLLIMVAGTIPFMSFVAEHDVTKKVRARMEQAPAA